ncbi:PDZK1-interacting protein 1 [Chelonia mydas]|uniref:PDZK1-interacting protein 1 n=1 Tax=Chelonia mydas TaxID=8469 RepID=M7BQ26_CHEMY|nr:PDZK1-interacting protein 1 [Chelonia mydas]
MDGGFPFGKEGLGGAACACEDKGAARGNLQPWMQGVIAVAVFLVLVAIAFAVNKFWCQEKEENMESVVTIGDKKEEDVVSNGTEGRYSITAADFRSKETQHAYENIIEYEGKVITTLISR